MSFLRMIFLVFFFFLGVFETRCLGFFCGYCSLAVFMTFAGHVQCKLLTNQTAGHTGSILIYLTDWVLHPGNYDVKVFSLYWMSSISLKLLFLEIQ